MRAGIDVVVIGGGQAGLATAYFLRRTGLDYLVLDDQSAPGGAWRHTWDSLHLFSPAQWSSLPGWQMPQSHDTYPSHDEVIAYLARFEDRYHIPVRRQVHVRSVSRVQGGLAGQYRSRGMARESSRERDRHLERAVCPRLRCRLSIRSMRPFNRFDADGVEWSDGTHSCVDIVIWCTGFRPALKHLDPLRICDANGLPRTDGTHARDEERLWLVGYGDWCGAASATLVGVMRSAREATQSIAQYLIAIGPRSASSP
jgi:hypothetical protein